MIPLDALGQSLGPVHHELVILQAKLLQTSRLLQQALKGLANIKPQVVLGQIQRLQVARTVDNRNGSFTLKVILTDFEYSQVLILAQSNSNALTSIRPEIIVIDCQRLNGLISNQKGSNADGSLNTK